MILNSCEISATNSDVHGKSDTEQTEKLLQHQKPLIPELLSRQHQCLPKDQFLFPNNHQELLDKKSTEVFYMQVIQNWTFGARTYKRNQHTQWNFAI